jgi:carboxyl-terminal processing protease
MIKRFKKPIIIVLAFVLGGLSFMSLQQIDNKNFEISKNLDIYFSLFRELNTFYVDEIDPAKLVKTSIDEMLMSLDPYTNYIPESDIEDFRFMTTGEYGGIGALISKQGNKIVVADPYEGFPAQKAGLMAGDVFLEVAGKSTDKMNTEDVSNLLKGPANQTVTVKVQRLNEKKPLTFNIMRETISIDPVVYSGMVDSKTGYIRLSNFTKDCAEKVKSAMLKLKEENGAEKLILDLRGNPGGLLVESVNLTNLFVGKDQEVVSTKGKVTQWDKVYKTTGNPVDTIMPIAVLINRGSASASEIVAGSIQDLDRGVVLGTRTFGKGLVQTTRDLSYNSKLKVTTAKYYIPSGRCIQALDYTHRNDDGSVGNIPDSLISEFKTRKGRKVYDGGGVSPDIQVESEDISTLAINLVQQFKFFDFATQFRLKTNSIAAPSTYKVDDKTYQEFVDFVLASDFKYESRTQKMLNDLKKMAENEKYYDHSSKEFEALEKSLQNDLKRDFNLFKTEISELLKDEIVSRYYYQKGAAQSSISDDKTIARALEILNNPTEYRRILNYK